MTTIDQIINAAKQGLIDEPDYPYGESEYRNIRCKIERKTGRTTFTINYKRASKAAVIETLKA